MLYNISGTFTHPQYFALLSLINIQHAGFVYGSIHQTTVTFETLMLLNCWEATVQGNPTARNELFKTSFLSIRGKQHPSAQRELRKSWQIVFNNDVYQHLRRGANKTLTDGEMTPFRNDLAPFGRSRKRLLQKSETSPQESWQKGLGEEGGKNRQEGHKPSKSRAGQNNRNKPKQIREEHICQQSKSRGMGVGRVTSAAANR